MGIRDASAPVTGSARKWHKGMDLKQTLKTAGKNISILIVTTISCVAISLFYGFQFWLPEQTSQLSGITALFGSIALMLVTILLFSIIGIAMGLICGIIILIIISARRRRD